MVPKQEQNLIHTMKLQHTLKSVAMTIGLTASVQAATITHYWSFDSDFTADIGGSSADFSAVNGATAGGVTGKFGNAADFNRDSSQYAVQTADLTSAGTDFSVSVWFYNDDPTYDGRQFILEDLRGDSIGTTASDYNTSIGLQTDLDAQFYIRDNGSVRSAPVSQNTWTNAILTFDADGAVGGGGLFTGYINGVQVGTLERNSTAIGGLVIGGHRAGTGRNFDGQIDDLAFYDGVLSSGEISNLQTASAAAVPEPSSTALIGLAGLGFILRRRR